MIAPYPFDPPRRPAAPALSARPTEFVTYTGARLDLLDPDPDDVRIEDIARSLSRICRSNGHRDSHYSVAEHSLAVARRLEDAGQPLRVVLAGLLHDAAEMVVSDVPTCVKLLCPDFRALESRILAAVFARFGVGELSAGEWIALKAADLAESEGEADGILEPMAPEEARREFLRVFRQLTQS